MRRPHPLTHLTTAMTKHIKTELKTYESELISLRQDLHQHPETGFEEHRTAKIIAEKLTSWGLEVHTGVGITGVVGVLRGRYPGTQAIGLRADMDALNMTETGDLPYRSVYEGKMHGCGHDGHSTMLLGAAKYLSRHPDFAGTVNFIFQPAEEGLGGASAMIDDGLFERFPCDSVYGMHNRSGIPVGHFGTLPGAAMSASDTWSTTFSGTGGHGGSMAHLATDLTITLAHFIQGIQTIISRNVPGIEPAVLSIGHISGGNAKSPSVMPASMFVTGTARSFSPAVRDTLERRLEELAKTCAALTGCQSTSTYSRGYPPLVNQPAHTARAVAAARAVAGDAQVNANQKPSTGAEDFAVMLEKRPGAYVWLGNGFASDGSVRPVHTPNYDFNDDALLFGAEYWVQLVHGCLGESAAPAT